MQLIFRGFMDKFGVVIAVCSGSAFTTWNNAMRLVVHARAANCCWIASHVCKRVAPNSRYRN